MALTSTYGWPAPLDISDNLFGLGPDVGRNGVDPASWFCVDVDDASVELPKDWS